MPNYPLFLKDRHQAFRPRVLFLENAPAETLWQFSHNLQFLAGAMEVACKVPINAYVVPTGWSVLIRPATATV